MSAAEPMARCARCGHGHSHAAWSALPLVHTLGEGDLRAYVVAWPAHARVEVRACSQCQGSIARLVGPPEARGLKPSARAG